MPSETPNSLTILWLEDLVHGNMGRFTDIIYIYCPCAWYDLIEIVKEAPSLTRIPTAFQDTSPLPIPIHSIQLDQPIWRMVNEVISTHNNNHPINCTIIITVIGRIVIVSIHYYTGTNTIYIFIPNRRIKVIQMNTIIKVDNRVICLKI